MRFFEELKTLIVVDMQNDFIDGTLGTKEAQSIVSNVAKKIKEYKENGCNVIFTRDTHPTNYLETYEGKHLPVVHCVSNFMGFLKGKSSLMIYEKWKRYASADAVMRKIRKGPGI